MRTFPEGSCQILTDGVWDLLQLNQEAKRKEIVLGILISSSR